MASPAPIHPRGLLTRAPKLIWHLAAPPPVIVLLVTSVQVPNPLNIASIEQWSTHWSSITQAVATLTVVAAADGVAPPLQITLAAVLPKRVALVAQGARAIPPSAS